MIYIGIDPGKSGAYAVIYPNAIVCEVWDEASFIEEMKNVDLNEEEVKACVEHVWALPRESAKASFSFGHYKGFIEGVLQTLGIPYELVTPQKWKKEFSLTSDKAKSVEVCRKLFPSVNLLATPRCRKAHDGMAEALLMAEYARRRL
ncbi:MAG: hypothetical protein IKT51_02825 [Phascolarctobacterium sp.]|nr:hypothetical protein [Phascolarctobacterium sp.]